MVEEDAQQRLGCYPGNEFVRTGNEEHQRAQLDGPSRTMRSVDNQPRVDAQSRTQSSSDEDTDTVSAPRIYGSLTRAGGESTRACTYTDAHAGDISASIAHSKLCSSIEDQTPGLEDIDGIGLGTDGEASSTSYAGTTVADNTVWMRALSSGTGRASFSGIPGPLFTSNPNNPSSLNRRRKQSSEDLEALEYRGEGGSEVKRGVEEGRRTSSDFGDGKGEYPGEVVLAGEVVLNHPDETHGLLLPGMAAIFAAAAAAATVAAAVAIFLKVLKRKKNELKCSVTTSTLLLILLLLRLTLLLLPTIY